MSLSDAYVHFRTSERVASKLDPDAPGSMRVNEIASALGRLEGEDLLQVAVEALARLGHHRPAAPSEIVGARVRLRGRGGV